MDELLPCPHCGAKANAGFLRIAEMVGPYRPAVSCSNCPSVIFAATLEDAATFWNTRTTAPSAREAAYKEFYLAHEWAEECNEVTWNDICNHGEKHFLTCKNELRTTCDAAYHAFNTVRAGRKGGGSMTLEHCINCDEPTGKAGRDEDSLYIECAGPFCEVCFSDEQQERIRLATKAVVAAAETVVDGYGANLSEDAQTVTVREPLLYVLDSALAELKAAKEAAR